MPYLILAWSVQSPLFMAISEIPRRCSGHCVSWTPAWRAWSSWSPLRAKGATNGSGRETQWPVVGELRRARQRDSVRGDGSPPSGSLKAAQRDARAAATRAPQGEGAQLRQVPPPSRAQHTSFHPPPPLLLRHFSQCCYQCRQKAQRHLPSLKPSTTTLHAQQRPTGALGGLPHSPAGRYLLPPSTTSLLPPARHALPSSTTPLSPSLRHTPSPLPQRPDCQGWPEALARRESERQRMPLAQTHPPRHLRQASEARGRYGLNGPAKDVRKREKRVSG